MTLKQRLEQRMQVNINLRLFQNYIINSVGEKSNLLFLLLKVKKKYIIAVINQRTAAEITIWWMTIHPAQEGRGGTEVLLNH